MPYFSFSFNSSFNIKNLHKFKLSSNQIKPNLTYFSKNTSLWKMLNSNKYLSNLNFIKFEKRLSIKKLGKKILFCLPPSIGLGDAVEYALAIKAVLNSNNFKMLGVAFVGRYKKIFEKLFKINNIYEEIITADLLYSYDTVFHVTHEIKELTNQKYDRKNIENLITNYFYVSKYRALSHINNNKIEKISIFPISQSPLRTMTVDLLNNIVDSFYKEKKIEIILYRKSEISNYIEKYINDKIVTIIHPKNLHDLLLVIENINFGIFMDSGPLHVAKILNKKGVLITSSVGKEKLLSDFSNIKSIDNTYKSFYCHSPCGLVNVFNYNNNIGCYDSLGIKKKEILKLKNFQKLQRGNLKKKYVNLIINPVNCLKYINNKKVINIIKQNLYNN